MTRAEDHWKGLFQIKPIDIQKVQYGKTETRAAIVAILGKIIPKYRYTSLPELNAVLSRYNVRAERGSEQSDTYKKGGLVCRILDAEGQPVGVPIKASLLPDNPGLKALEKRYAVNEALRKPHEIRLKAAIDLLFAGGRKISLKGLIKELHKKGIDTLIRQNEEGRIYGLTFIDHQTRCVFNGGDLGKQYSA